jgi:hypothetical protein
LVIDYLSQFKLGLKIKQIRFEEKMASTRKRYPDVKKKEKRTSKRSNRTKNPWLPVLGVVGMLAGAVALFIFLTSIPSSGASAPIENLLTYPNLDRGHTNQAVTYAQNPPAGGQHNAVWQNCGVYSQPIQNENAVHSLEHGAIWITYQPDLPAAELQKLQDLTRRSAYRLLSPYPDLPAPIVASAWGYQVQIDSADDARLGQFIQKYEQNPLGPEPGAPCTGGTGTPG